MTNRRKHARVTIKAVSQVTFVEGGRSIKAFVGGISRGGLEIYTDDPVDKGTRVDVTLTFLSKNGKPIDESVGGSVRWASPFEEHYICGIEFDALLDTRVNPALTEYLDEAEEQLRKFF
jgi:PilZ domain